MSLSINGLPATSMLWYAGWSGVWVAELETQGEVVPSGRVLILSTEGISAVGTVDPDHTGTFGEKRHVRVLGGGGGWGKSVRPQHYHSDIGVPLLTVASTTAAEVGEIVNVLTPKTVGTDYVRVGDDDVRASQIFEDAGVDWWVGLDGVTTVGVLRPQAVPDPSLQILDWDPVAGTMSFTCAVLVVPGTVIADTRFGTRIVREVEAKVAGGSVTGTLWVVDEQPDAGTASELADSIAVIANAATRVKFSRFYEYRVIFMEGDRVELQAVNSVDGVPDILPASIWAGLSGYRASLRLSSRVLVGFRSGDPAQPFVAFYEAPEGDGWRPNELELDAVASVTIGAQATSVSLGAADGAMPVARLTPSFAAWIAAVAVATSTAAPTDIASAKVVSS